MAAFEFDPVQVATIFSVVLLPADEKLKMKVKTFFFIHFLSHPTIFPRVFNVFFNWYCVTQESMVLGTIQVLEL